MDITEEIVSKPEEIVARKKKVYIKRKAEVLQTLEKKEDTNEKKKDDTANAKKEVTPEVDGESDEEPPPTKRVKITKDDQTTESTPSIWRGSVTKPLLLAVVSAASFYVHSVYRTTQPPSTNGYKTTPIIKKKTSSELQTPIHMFSTKLQTASDVIPGFTRK